MELRQEDREMKKAGVCEDKRLFSLLVYNTDLSSSMSLMM